MKFFLGYGEDMIENVFPSLRVEDRSEVSAVVAPDSDPRFFTPSFSTRHLLHDVVQTELVAQVVRGDEVGHVGLGLENLLGWLGRTGRFGHHFLRGGRSHYSPVGGLGCRL